LFTGLVCVSTSGPFLVMAKMDAYSLVLLRLAISAVVMLVWARAQGARMDARHWPRMIGGALLLAAHFVLWLKAFDLTDYASNLLLLVAQPVIAAAIGRSVGEAPKRGTWIAIALATAGLVAIAKGDFALGTRALVGDGMCILGGLAITMFYVVTREARLETPLPLFMGITFGIGAIVVTPVVLAAGSPVRGYGWSSWIYVALLVVVTTVAGHGLMNLAARRVKLFTLNLVIVLEPAIGIAMGAAMFGARMSWDQLGGGVLLAAAVIVGLRHG
jgi:drug/metabolite transporter (DMT)-like permease